MKLLEALVVDSDRQLYYYDPGVGTPTSYLPDNSGLGLKGRLLGLAGLAWGGGVWQNVSEGYRFLMQNYLLGDRIFVFGFSRGAFTARGLCLFPFLARFGLRMEDPGGYPSKVGVLVGYSGFLVPVWDALKNLFTFLAADLADETHCCSTLLTTVASFAVSLMSSLKLVTMAVFSIAIIYCLLRGTFKVVRGLLADAADA